MSDLIRRDDALAACDIGPCSEWNDYTKDKYSLAADDCKRGIAALPTVDPATLTSKPVDDSKTANPVVNDHIADVGKMVDPAAIREAALLEAAEVADKLAAEWWVTYKNIMSVHCADPHYQGMSDGADEVSNAILALIGEKK